MEGLPVHKKILTFFRLLLFNLYTSSLCDGFIFGEYYKSLPFRILFPYKKWEIVSYFPDLSYINYRKSNLNPGQICLGYTGKISVEKGIKNFFDVANTLKSKNPDIDVKLKIIGWCLSADDKSTFERLCRESINVSVELLGRQDFENFSDKLLDIDILFDLRKLDFENNHCLAIKVFYYAACGKPVIYSNIKAIKREIDVTKFGYFVNPVDSEIISCHIVNYIQNPDLYRMHCGAARKLAEINYNWGIIESRFTDFITKFQN
ncbi:MAG: glycosyltransferase [Prolixibacteraceae bacterium]